MREKCALSVRMSLSWNILGCVWRPRVQVVGGVVGVLY